jgi:hypothetical protein
MGYEARAIWENGDECLSFTPATTDLLEVSWGADPAGVCQGSRAISYNTLCNAILLSAASNPLIVSVLESLARLPSLVSIDNVTSSTHDNSLSTKKTYQGGHGSQSSFVLGTPTYELIYGLTLFPA